MEQEILNKIKGQEKKIDEINDNVRKIKKVLFWRLMITLAFVILSITGVSLAIPRFLEVLGDIKLGI